MVYVPGKQQMPQNFTQIQEMEELAKQKELGIWHRDLKLVSENNNNGGASVKN